MRALLPVGHVSVPLNADALNIRQNSSQSCLKPLLALAESSDYLIAGLAGEFEAEHQMYQIPRFIFMGPGGGGETIRLGIFAGIYGDQPEGTEALVEFLQELELRPEIANGYHIYVYPICNPTGFVAKSRLNLAGEDLTKHFWNGSSQPEIYYLEREIGVLKFHGIISVHTQDNFESFALEINRSALLTRALAKPAIQATQRFLPGSSTLKTDISATGSFPAFYARDFLTAGHELEPVPFELHFGIPGQVPRPSQIHGTVSAFSSILETYRGVLSIGQNICKKVEAIIATFSSFAKPNQYVSP
jgi:murein peptide amidase A